ncbi:MAG TPA: GNAT family N-acetyltransferase, partial [Candidatus Limnocylindrales bacterium]
MSAKSTVVEGLTLRTATAADWPAIAAIVNAARRADGADEVRTAESLESEFAAYGREQGLVIAEVNGEAIGYASSQLAERDGVLVGDLMGALHPAFRRRGIGTELLHRTRDGVIARMAEDPRPLSRELRAFALDSEAGIIAMLTAEGFVPIRFGFEMRRALTGILPIHPLPAGLEMRPAIASNYRAIFEANEEAFRDHWGHRPTTEDDFRQQFFAPDVTPALWCVAWDGDQVAGVVMNTIYADENEALGVRRGWLDKVSVRRPWRGRGVAKALCSASFRVLRDQGMDEACLGVDGSNPTGAVQLYEGLGFHVMRR